MKSPPRNTHIVAFVVALSLILVASGFAMEATTLQEIKMPIRSGKKIVDSFTLPAGSPVTTGGKIMPNGTVGVWYGEYWAYVMPDAINLAEAREKEANLHDAANTNSGTNPPLGARTPPLEIEITGSNVPVVANTSGTITTHNEALHSQDPHKMNQFSADDFLKAAQAGDVTAQYNLGCIYDRLARNRNLPEAFKWFYQAAHGSDSTMFAVAMAQQRLANDYFWGRGVKKDSTEAARWYEESRKSFLSQVNHPGNGGRLALFNLGEIYAKGLGVPKDEAAAFTWYTKASEKGYVWAYVALGDAYLEGRGVAADKSNAIFWLQKAADAGNSRAVIKLATITGESNPQKAAAIIDQETQKIIAKQESLGPGAEHRIGDQYYVGIDVVKNFQEAAKWYQKAVDMNQTPDSWMAAQKLSGLYTSGGGGINADQNLAFYWLQKSAELGNSSAARGVAMKYKSGHGVTINPEAAQKWNEWADELDQKKQAETAH